jgi:ATP-dependent Clp protease adaptor protein ClpS
VVVPFWRRALDALRPKPPNLDGRVRFSLDATDALAAGTLVEALLDSAELAPFVRAIGGVPKAVPVSVRLDRVRFVAQASVLGAGRDEARCGDLLYAVLRLDKAAADALAAAGLTRAKLTSWLAHGVVEHAVIDVAKVARGETLEVVLHNDDFTPQDFVVRVLREIAGLEHADAAKRMLEVHHEGASIIATLPRKDAVDVANKVVAAARIAGFPLLATVESFESSEA